MPNNKPTATVRMYRQGLGDCFLLTLQQPGSDPVRILIDCGVLLGTKGAKATMTQVAEDIRDSIDRAEDIEGENLKYLDHVLVTHEHYDHTSGFALAKEAFEQMHFGQVWTAWLDDKRHPNYMAVRERFRKQILGLTGAVARMTAESTAALKETVNSILEEFFDPALLAANTDLEVRSPAWEFVLSRSVEEPRYCIPGSTFVLPGLDKFRFYILGPPEDYTTFTSIEPPEDETYRSDRQDASRMAIADNFFAAVGGGDSYSQEMCQPFEQHLRVSQKDACDPTKYPFFDLFYGFDPHDQNEWRRIGEDWLMTAGALALNLDSYTNNTCLAIAIEFVDSGRFMLFPGDSQFANWRSWQKLVFKVPTPDGKIREVKFEDLLAKTVFYKVGHHGSHNATLKKNGLEKMSHPDLAAMIPVDREMARKKTSKNNPHGWEMPEGNLYERLLERTRGRVVLADENDHAELTARCPDKRFIKNVSFGGTLKREDRPDENLYIEYTLVDE